MSLLSSLLLLPVTGPVRGVQWTLDKVRRVAEQELTDDTPVKEQLLELHRRLEDGEIDEDAYVREEAEVMARLREVYEWRRRLGQGSGPGPVRVARDDE